MVCPEAEFQCRHLFSLQLAATKFPWFTTKLCTFWKFIKAKTVQNSSAQQGCETSVQKEKQYKAGFMYLIAPCWCQSVPNPLQNLLQTLNLRCFVLMWYTLLVAYNFNRLTVFQVSAKDNTQTEIHGKNSFTMDFAYSRVDCVDDCWYSS